MANRPGKPVHNRRRASSKPPSTVARIVLWRNHVGAVSEDGLGNIAFEYTKEFRESGLEISPIHLPLTLRGPVSFPQLNRIPSFAGLPGVLADCLPGAFGNTVIRRYFEQQGRPEAAMSPVQKLLYIGNRAMGALEFGPPIDIGAAPGGDEALQIARLVQEARRVIEGDPSVAIPEMMQVGASAGGARAKALILFNPTTREVRSAFAPAVPGDEHWLVKFDGVTTGGGGHETEQSFKPGPFGRIEYVYSLMARAARIDMEPTQLLTENGRAHFMTKRFDRVNGDRLHMHTLGGIQHADYNVRQSLSYEDYFRTVRRLGMGQPAVDQAFRRMVFNLTARNQDDHVKNVAFLMNQQGTWALAPAFDMTWAYGGQWAQTHQMTAQGKDDGFTRADILAVGRAFDIPKDGADIIDEVQSAMGLWRSEAKAVELESAWISQIESQFRRFR